MEADKLHQLKTQIEYYLSDENLKKDKFFHEKINENTEGFLNAALFLNCNKVKKLEVTLEDIINAIKLSTNLELNEDNTKVRRTGSKPLPELKLLTKKTQREDEGEKSDEEHEETQSLDPIILEFKSDKVPEFKWKNIQDKFKEDNPHLKVAYLRFKTDAGHIGVFNQAPELTFNDKFEIEGVNFEVKKCEGDELINFWKDHGGHFELCVGRGGRSDKKGGRKDRKKKDTSYLKTPITLADETFTDVTRIRQRARQILIETKDGEQVKGNDSAFLLDLLKGHRNFEEKTKDMTYITTGRPAEHTYSRCFFIVKGDDKKEDFSIHKCIERIANDNKKK